MIRRYLLGAGRRVQFSLKNPGYAARALFAEFTNADEKFLAHVTGAPWRRVREYIEEPLEDPEFLGHLRQWQRDFEQLQMAGAELFAKKILVQYAVVRALAPDKVVETGVANGVSSAYLLHALRRNEKGHLYSVEINDPSYLPPGRAPGWLVPENLRCHWTMILGSSENVLLGLLTQLRKIDVFIHDSLHTYEHMKFEFDLVYPFLRPGGVLLADDATWNPAFPEFVVASRASTSRIIRGVGVLTKP